MDLNAEPFIIIVNKTYIFFSGFFLFCIYTRSPVAGTGVKMLRNARSMVRHEPPMLVSTYRLHCTHPTP